MAGNFDFVLLVASELYLCAYVNGLAIPLIECKS